MINNHNLISKCSTSNAQMHKCTNARNLAVLVMNIVSGTKILIYSKKVVLNPQKIISLCELWRTDLWC